MVLTLQKISSKHKTKKINNDFKPDFDKVVVLADSGTDTDTDTGYLTVCIILQRSLSYYNWAVITSFFYFIDKLHITYS